MFCCVGTGVATFAFSSLNPKTWEIYVVPAQATGEPGGVGELGISPAAGAVANAYARATGTKPRNFPIVNF